MLVSQATPCPTRHLRNARPERIGACIPMLSKGMTSGKICVFTYIEEMKSLGTIDIAFIPANLPYTMTPEMAADAARKIQPRILYPYHFGDTSVRRIAELLSDMPEMEVRIRAMK